jgi:hypothetical protein
MRAPSPNDPAYPSGAERDPAYPSGAERDPAYLSGAELYPIVRVAPRKWSSESSERSTDSRISLAGNAARESSTSRRHRTLKITVDEHLLKLTMPGRAYSGPLTSATVDRAKHAVAVGDAALRDLSQMVVRADNRGVAAASVDTRAFMLCLLPWVLGRIDAAWASIDAPTPAHAA